MKLFTAPVDYDLELNDIACFLAGGITNCPNWQKDVIKRLENTVPVNDKYPLVLFNPRRENFENINEDEVAKQIYWEFRYLNEMDIFSMYFCESSKSNLPICLYELGRYIEVMKRRFGTEYLYRICITIEEGYSRKQDVVYQTELATGISFYDGVIQPIIKEVKNTEEGIIVHSNRINTIYKAIINKDNFYNSRMYFKDTFYNISVGKAINSLNKLDETI